MIGFAIVLFLLILWNALAYVITEHKLMEEFFIVYCTGNVFLALMLLRMIL